MLENYRMWILGKACLNHDMFEEWLVCKVVPFVSTDKLIYIAKGKFSLEYLQKVRNAAEMGELNKLPPHIQGT